VGERGVPESDGGEGVPLLKVTFGGGLKVAERVPRCTAGEGIWETKALGRKKRKSLFGIVKYNIRGK